MRRNPVVIGAHASMTGVVRSERDAAPRRIDVLGPAELESLRVNVIRHFSCDGAAKCAGSHVEPKVLAVATRHRCEEGSVR